MNSVAGDGLEIQRTNLRPSSRISAIRSTPRVRRWRSRQFETWDESVSSWPEQQADPGRPQVRQKFSSCDMIVIRWLFVFVGWKQQKDRSRILYSWKFFSLESRVCKCLSKFWTGLKMRLRICKVAAMRFGIFLNPRSFCEMKYIIRQSWSGGTWKQTQPELATSGSGGIGADDTILMEGVEGRVRLPQQVSTCVSLSTVLSVYHSGNIF